MSEPSKTEPSASERVSKTIHWPSGEKTAVLARMWPCDAVVSWRSLARGMVLQATRANAGSRKSRRCTRRDCTAGAGAGAKRELCPSNEVWMVMGSWGFDTLVARWFHERLTADAARALSALSWPGSGWGIGLVLGAVVLSVLW